MARAFGKGGRLAPRWIACDPQLLMELPGKRFHWNFITFNFAPGELPEAAVMFPQGSPMHQPAAIAARQSACDNRDPRLGHDGIFSICERLINLFLTPSADFTKHQDKRTRWFPDDQGTIEKNCR
jgi:hypothetical protein